MTSPQPSARTVLIARAVSLAAAVFIGVTVAWQLHALAGQTATALILGAAAWATKPDPPTSPPPRKAAE